MQNKVVINRCHGGFSLSTEAVRYAKSMAPEGSLWHSVSERFGFIDDEEIARHDPILLKVVEDLGESASGECSELCVVTINSNMYRVTEYDGLEGIESPDSVDWVVI